MSQDTNHLVALHDGLLREKTRLSDARSEDERNYRAMKVDQARRELNGELVHLGMADDVSAMASIDDDALLDALLKN